jgi:chemotaxis response regulator CheB
MPIRVLLADDSDSLRGVIERHLKSEPKIEPVGQAKEFQEAVKLTDELSPDGVVPDLRMTSGVDLNRRYTPDMPVLDNRNFRKH